MQNTWEQFEGTGKAMDLDTLIPALQTLRKDHGNIAVNFRNYLEANTIAPCTNVTVDHGQIVLESNDLPESERL